ncbi:exopolyphosphatase [Alishewanella sp. SMS8]|uniref:Ppx/GppA phosphatase family protein n=1 Tax=Alishewanella sp. SMS8 TaxID=2994676 RepID=UPI0027424D52|nr:exopolyphosphatase [Alishewanella sp. SMS8]MDP5206700.1 exopolyphosphatase [Alishewanella sp. SMS9]MDP5458743.1 exopolyphosphatase [Alishewanella sp. SMS8]
MTTTTEQEQGQAPYIAAVDLGSNSFHMVIARIVKGDIQLLHREKQKVQLAEGLSDDLVLSEDAIERGLNVLRQFADTLQPFAPQSVRVIATYTLRRAKNSATFLRRAKTLFPFPIEVISGQEEARFIYQGVAHFEHFSGRRLVIDIGGGSTEFALGEAEQPLRLSSRNMGCVSYGKSLFPQGKISSRRFNRAIVQAEQELEPIVNSFRTVGWQQAVGTSGSVKTIRDIVVGFGWSTHALELAHLLQLRNYLLKFENCQDLDLPGLTDDRKLLLCSALSILIAAFQMLHIEQLVYVDAALREGVLYEMSDRMQHLDIREQTMQSLVQRYDIDQAQAQRVRSTALALVTQVKDSWQLNEEDALLLSFAATVAEIGLHINSSGVQKHSAYILQNANLPGFNQEQQNLLACLVRFHRRKIRADELPYFSLFELSKVINLLIILRLAVLLNQKRRDDFLPDLLAEAGAQTLKLDLPLSWLQTQNVLAADLLQEQKNLKKIAFKFDIPSLQELSSQLLIESAS